MQVEPDIAGSSMRGRDDAPNLSAIAVYFVKYWISSVGFQREVVMAPLKTGDSGDASIVTARTYVWSAGMPAATAATDYGVATTTTARANIWQPQGVDNNGVAVTNPPTATADPGSA